MKKDYIYLAVIALLFILFFVQSGFNQSKYNSKSNSENEIGRYQYFTNPDGSVQGFLDTKAGFLFFLPKSPAMPCDIKEYFSNYFFERYRKDIEDYRLKSKEEGLDSATIEQTIELIFLQNHKQIQERIK